MTAQIKHRFTGLLPLVVDIETSGTNWNENAILEIAAITLQLENNTWALKNTFHQHVQPFEGAIFEPTAMKINRIVLDDQKRQDAVCEPAMLNYFKQFIAQETATQECKKAILVGHNGHFDLNFLNQACMRNQAELNLHKFSTIDTTPLCAIFFKETVLARTLFRAGITWEGKKAHTALYDAEKTAELFCKILNDWDHHLHPAQKTSVKIDH